MNRTDDTEDKKQTSFSFPSPIKSLFDKFAKHRDVDLVYGDPIAHGDQRIVPVAKMRYSFGGGSGGNTNTENEEPAYGYGDGGGGYMSVKPLGVYQLKANRVHFKPVIDLKFIFPMFTVLSLGLAFLFRRKRS